MVQYKAFNSASKFYPKTHFPYGIDRSGEFTIEQSERLITHGEAYQALHDGTRLPANKEEEQFVAVCRGERAPTTAHERAWSVFCQKTQKKRAVVSFCSTSNPIANERHDHHQDW